MSTSRDTATQRRQPLVARWVPVTDGRGRARLEMRWDVARTTPAVTPPATPAQVALIA